MIDFNILLSVIELNVPHNVQLCCRLQPTLQEDAGDSEQIEVSDSLINFIIMFYLACNEPNNS